MIASRNRAAELAATITRLLGTTNCPIILVDNNSEDDSVGNARRIEARSANRLQIIELDSNRGAVGRNVGVAACRTPFVAFCDDDSWWAPDATTIAEEIFDGHPTVGLLAARTKVWPQRRDDPLADELANSALGRRLDLPGPSILGFLACPELVAVHPPSALRPTTAAQDARSLRNAVLTTWMRRPIRHCLKATGSLIWAALHDGEHARGAAQALMKLPASVEQALALLESG